MGAAIVNAKPSVAGADGNSLAEKSRIEQANAWIIVSAIDLVEVAKKARRPNSVFGHYLVVVGKGNLKTTRPPCATTGENQGIL
jgi:hypothetical protein